MLWKKLILVLGLSACAFGQTDGPATLPQRTPETTLVSANPVQTIPISGLQAALTSAQCGDSFSVLPGDWTGGLKLPQGCDAAHAITVTGQAGARILECGSQAVQGGVFVVFSGFEVTRPSTCTTIAYGLIVPGTGAHDIVYTNLNVHGDPRYETTRGLALYGTYNVAVLNSTFTDFHCLAKTGSCTDAQAIAWGVNDAAGTGGYLIQGNTLQASGENVAGGGGADTVVPCDITITGNTITKPQIWNKASLSYSGIEWVVKNLLEIKNGCRVLIEKNTFSGNWGGYSQNGSAILLTPKNQNGLCAACAVTDITVRYNRVDYSGTALQLACIPSDSGALAAACGNWSIHDNQFNHLQYSTCYGCSGKQLMQLSTSTASSVPVLQNVSVDHNSFEVDGWPQRYSGFLLIGGLPGSANGISFTNNVVPQGDFPMYFTGGTNNCAYGVIFQSYSQALSNCWGTYSFSGNVLLTRGETQSGTAPASTWPAGNTLINAGANPRTLP